MSGKMVGIVFDCDLDPILKYVFICLADHADHEGENIRPGVGLIAWKVGCDERTIQRHLRTLEQKGYIERVTSGLGGRGRKTEYRIVVDALPIRNKGEGKGGKVSPFRLSKRVTHTPPIQNVKGDTGDQERVTLDGKNPADTSEREPSEEPSVSLDATASESGTKKPRKKTTKPADPGDAKPPTPVWAIVEAFFRAVGRPGAELGLGVNSAKRQGAVAKRLHADGITPADVERIVEWLRSKKWRDAGIDLLTVEQNVAKWIAAGKPGGGPQEFGLGGSNHVESAQEFFARKGRQGGLQ